jgi:hypothetical protein
MAAEVTKASLSRGTAFAVEDTLGPAPYDSLVVAGERLADALTMERAVSDSLRRENRWKDMEIEYLEDQKKRWYHDERLWFLAGSLAAYATVSVVAD